MTDDFDQARERLLHLISRLAPLGVNVAVSEEPAERQYWAEQDLPDDLVYLSELRELAEIADAHPGLITSRVVAKLASEHGKLEIVVSGTQWGALAHALWAAPCFESLELPWGLPAF